MTVEGRAGTPRHRGYALCVGIDAYHGEQQLTGAVADARLWSRVLAAQGLEVIVLTDREATARSILDALRTITKSPCTADALVFTFSGFGAVASLPAEGSDVRELFLPVDYQDGEAITSGDLSDALGLPGGATLTCFFDCCFQGTVTRVITPHAQESSPGDQRPRFVPSIGELRSRFESRRSSMPMRPNAEPAAILAFNACGRSELAWERDGLGEFTRRAAGLMAGGIPRLSNRAFNQRIVEAFGPTPRQTPTFDSLFLTDRPFLERAVRAEP